MDGRTDAGEETGEEEVRIHLDLGPESDAERIARLEREVAHILAQSRVTLAMRYKRELQAAQKRCARLEKKLARRSARGTR